MIYTFRAKNYQGKTDILLLVDVFENFRKTRLQA